MAEESKTDSVEASSVKYREHWASRLIRYIVILAILFFGFFATLLWH